MKTMYRKIVITLEILLFDLKCFTCKIEKIYYITFLISLCVQSMHLESE